MVLPHPGSISWDLGYISGFGFRYPPPVPSYLFAMIVRRHGNGCGFCGNAEPDAKRERALCLFDTYRQNFGKLVYESTHTHTHTPVHRLYVAGQMFDSTPNVRSACRPNSPRPPINPGGLLLCCYVAMCSRITNRFESVERIKHIKLVAEGAQGDSGRIETICVLMGLTARMCAHHKRLWNSHLYRTCAMKRLLFKSSQFLCCCARVCVGRGEGLVFVCVCVIFVLHFCARNGVNTMRLRRRLLRFDATPEADS